ncbi:alcohol oxidase [Leucogyrophana mollusca]|uniref:Alcohol oxidase n=1 Tax=Leucogyrophana mollusca TaxID=85980 RepID=A0ACB8BML5_9AGAM|nr:alcohol oxidase [Leucogyrophana mollusca]
MSNPAHSEYDIIFAGGGAAACLAAGRLADADSSLKILVLEQGLHTRNIDAHTQPARYFSHLKPTSKTVTFNVGNPSEELGGRSLVTPSGRCVGGGSSVNFTMYTRAAASDYDDWETVYGNAGWGSKDLLPLLKKACFATTECYQVKPNEPTHGYSGPLKVSWGGIYTNVGKQFLEVASQFDKERGFADDPNGLYSCNTYGRWQKWIDGETGRRSDVPHHFIYNKNHENLEVIDGKRIKRVIFENNRAVGVEYSNDVVSLPDAEQTLRGVRASRLVVLSAGAFGSPTILERSGVGAKTILDQNGVKQVVDLPGVGENYQDHNVIFVPYLASDDAETLDALFRGEKEEEERCVAQWVKEGKGLLAHNGIDAGVKLRPTAEELEELGPEFQNRWQTHFANAPDKPVIWLGPVAAYLGDPSVASARKYYSMGYFTHYPASLGKVHIKSGEDHHAAPDFAPGFLSDPADVAALRWGYKKSRELARRMGIYRGEFTPGHPDFPGNTVATCKERDGSIDTSAPAIVYTADDEKAIEAYSRKFVQTAWHSLGTCAMMPREKGGVVDERLNVYGVEGLKVADISIAPGNVGANTYSTALVIGEKAAVIIGEDLGIKGI